jgi:L,D-peptidoglycan transpeptidase YkuD (ErfK/YbiS/YcfS/YnhG family)
MKIIVKNNTLSYDDFIFKCSIGKNGISTKKIEGDKKTQKAYIPLVLYILEKTGYRNQ